MVIIAAGGERVIFRSIDCHGPITLRAQLETLAANYGFVISGLDQISAGDAPRSVEGNVEDRLKALLEDYNYVVIAF